MASSLQDLTVLAQAMRLRLTVQQPHTQSGCQVLEVSQTTEIWCRHILSSAVLPPDPEHIWPYNATGQNQLLECIRNP